MKCRFLKSILKLLKVITFIPVFFIVFLLETPYWIINDKSLLDMYGDFLTKNTSCNKQEDSTTS